MNSSKKGTKRRLEPQASSAKKCKTTTTEKASQSHKPANTEIKNSAIPKDSKLAKAKGLKPANAKDSKLSVPKDSKSAISKDPKQAIPKDPKAAIPKDPKPAIPKNPKQAIPNDPKPAIPKDPKPSIPKDPKPANPRMPKPPIPKTQTTQTTTVQSVTSNIQSPSTSDSWMSSIRVNGSIIWMPANGTYLEYTRGNTTVVMRRSTEVSFAYDNAVATYSSDRNAEDNLLDRTTVKFPYESSASKPEERCTICLVKYNVNDSLRRLPCFHYFHCECIDTWLKRKNMCPLCRSSLKA